MSTAANVSPFLFLSDEFVQSTTVGNLTNPSPIYVALVVVVHILKLSYVYLIIERDSVSTYQVALFISFCDRFHKMQRHSQFLLHHFVISSQTLYFLRHDSVDSELLSSISVHTSCITAPLVLFISFRKRFLAN